MTDEDDRTNQGTPTQETPQNPLEELDATIEQLEREVREFVGDIPPSSQPQSGEREATPPQQPDQQEETPPQQPDRQEETPPQQSQPSQQGAQQRSQQPIGVSSAYANMNLGVSKDRPKRSAPPIPPERPKKNDKDYKSIFELFWKEVVLELYAFPIDKATDLTLDFVDYVFYNSKKDNSDEPLDHYTLARGVRDKDVKGINKKTEKAKSRLAEIINNLEAVKNGEEPTWSINKRKPRCFDQVSEVYNKPEADRTVEEKIFLGNFFNSIIEIEKMGKAEEKLISIAAGCAAEKVRNDDMNGDVVSAKFTENMAKIEEELKKQTPNGIIITSLITSAKKEANGSGEVYGSILENLKKMQEAVDNNDMDTVGKCVKGIHEIERNNVDNEQFRIEKIEKAKNENIAAIRAEEERLIASGQQHTVSKEFTDELRDVNQVINNNNLSEAEKKAKLTELTTSMKERLADNIPEQSAMKAQLIEIGTKLQNGDMNILNELQSINKTHAENTPIYKFTQKQISNAEKLKEINDSRKGLKGMVRAGNKRNQAKVAGAVLEDGFNKDAPTAPSRPKTLVETLYSNDGR